MVGEASLLARWDERIARARDLADRHPTAADLLTFYAKLAEYQKSLAAHWTPGGNAPATTDALLRTIAPSHPGTVAPSHLGTVAPSHPGTVAPSHPGTVAPSHPGTVAPSHHRTIAPLAARLVAPVLDAVPDFLTWLSDVAPPRLAGAAMEMRRLDRSAWRAVLDEYLHPTAHKPRGGDPGPRCGPDTEAAPAARVFVVEALVQPLAERLAGERPSRSDRPTSSPATGRPRCPFCDDAPVVGVLREEGEGAKRSLVCGLCLTEWKYLRLVCPGCGEQRFDALPVFRSDQIPGARVEACDTCRRYLKTIDLTRDGHAVPYVDDLATVSLDLWARDQGYARLRSNLLMT